MKHLLCCPVTRLMSHFTTDSQRHGCWSQSRGHLSQLGLSPPPTLESPTVFCFHQREPCSRRSRPLR